MGQSQQDDTGKSREQGRGLGYGGDPGLGIDEIIHHYEIGGSIQDPRSQGGVAVGDANASDPFSGVELYSEKRESLTGARRGDEEGSKRNVGSVKKLERRRVCQVHIRKYRPKAETVDGVNVPGRKKLMSRILLPNAVKRRCAENGANVLVYDESMLPKFAAAGCPAPTSLLAPLT